MSQGNKATAKQALFCASLAAKLGQTIFNEAFENAAKLNGNATRGSHETVIQAVRRLNKAAASKLIDHLMQINNGDFVPEISVTPKPTTYLVVVEPELLLPVEKDIPNDLLNR